MSDDAPELQALIKDASTVDLDTSAADRIAARTRRDVGHGPPRRRLILPILVGALAAITILWALYKAYEALQ
jgi:hypothetical protein